MAAVVPAGARLRPPASMPDSDLRSLFHRLNNQLGTILAHAELLESKAPSAGERARASQIVASALEAMTTAREIRQQTTDSRAES